MTREQLILQMQQEYAERREDNLRLYDERVDAACARCDLTRPVAARIETEPVCLACYNSIRMRPRSCGICGATKLVPSEPPRRQLGVRS